MALDCIPQGSASEKDRVGRVSPPPSQRRYRLELSRARRKLRDASSRFGLLRYHQALACYLHCSGNIYTVFNIETTFCHVIYFPTNDEVPAKDGKAIPAALDYPQLTVSFPEPAAWASPLAHRSSGIEPRRGVE